MRQGTGVALRRRAESVTPLEGSGRESGWDSVVVEGPVHELSDEVLTHGTDVVVEGPQALRDEVVTRLRAVAGADAAGERGAQ